MTEKEYIERNAVIAELQEEIEFETAMYTAEQNDYFNRGLKCALKDVRRHPSADVVEVRHGEWVQNPYCNRIFYCSECGRTVEDGSYNPNPSEHFPYCHCGARMDGGKHETD